MAALNRVVLLRVIDSLWVEHLTAVDDMRRSVGLRAYSQRDPLNEFKVEAFRMFEELKAMIRRDVARTIFRVNVVRQPAPTPAQRMVESRPDLSGNGSPAAVGFAPRMSMHRCRPPGCRVWPAASAPQHFGCSGWPMPTGRPPTVRGSGAAPC